MLFLYLTFAVIAVGDRSFVSSLKYKNISKLISYHIIQIIAGIVELIFNLNYVIDKYLCYDYLNENYIFYDCINKKYLIYNCMIEKNVFYDDIKE